MHDFARGDNLQDMILYHGSREGIQGKIAPISRNRCDFGAGFYLGEDEKQVKGLILDNPNSVFYTVKLNLSKISEDRILVLDGIEWINTVLAYRGVVSEFCKLEIAKQCLDKANSADIIIGPIADDRMYIAMQYYADSLITDKALLECLKYVKYGNQYVLKTEYACSLVEIIKQSSIESELDEIRKYAASRRAEGEQAVKIAMRKNRDGKYLDELIQQEQKLFGQSDLYKMEV